MYVGYRIKKLRTALGMSQSELADRVGISQPTLSHLEKTPGASTKYIDAFAEALNTTVRYLLEGVADIKVPASKAHVLINDAGTPPGMIAIPLYKEVELSAGNGSCVFDESKITDNIWFTEAFFERHSAKPEEVVCAKISGDSMEPRFEDGGIVAIDLGHKKIKDGEVYAVHYHDHLFFKKVRMLPGKLLLTSENPIYKPVEAELSDVIIIGKVISYTKEL